jgi:hypothetical protein
MHIVRSFGIVRLAIAAVVLIGLAVGWVVTSVQRSAARGDARETVAWFYKDARFSSFAGMVAANAGYLADGEQGGTAIQPAFDGLDLQNFCNEFSGEGVKCPEKLHFDTDNVALQDNDGATAHVIVSGKVAPDSIKRGRTRYSFSDDTYETFAHIVTVTKRGDKWYVTQIEPLA